jgi:aerobic-type carbon monoxide dehydrogenase small subunit (CoxS/CutS family)
MSTTIELHVNGIKHRLQTDAGRSLLSVLRDDLELTGCKYGCGEGRCGACTVLIEGRAIRSCTTTLGDVAGKQVRTLEGLGQEGKLHPLQQAFLDVGAMQCGYCTAGMILSGVALLSKHPNPSREDIVRALDGNLCRCGTYGRITAAVRQAADSMKGGTR